MTPRPLQRQMRILKFLMERGVPDYKRIPGNLSIQVWRRPDGDKVHFYTVTTWDSMDSIKKFAGDEVDKAKYYPEDTDFLLSPEAAVMHCETIII